HDELLTNDIDLLRIGPSATDHTHFHSSPWLAREKVLSLTDRHFAGSESGDRFQEVPAMQAGFFARTVGKHRGHDDVAGTLAEIQTGFAGAGVRALLFVLGIFARSEIAGFGIEGFQETVKRASGDEVHVGLVDVILLYLLENLAVDLQRFIRLVIGGAA